MVRSVVLAVALIVLATTSYAQLNDVTQTPNTENVGIKKSLIQQVGTGRGNVMTPDSSRFIIKRDPARSVVRGRQLFQRKFTLLQGLGPRTGDGVGNIETDVSHGAGLADSCAACHGRPRGAAGFGGDVFTRPDSRDAPHLFGLGLVEMLGDEITSDLRHLRDKAVSAAAQFGQSVSLPLQSKGIDYGTITADAQGNVDTTGVVGVDADLRVKPFFHEGSEFSIRAFAVGAFDAEMGLEAWDPTLAGAAAGNRRRSPSGMVFDGALDTIAAPPASGPNDDPDGDGVTGEIHPALVDHMEFYLLNYFKPGLYRQGNHEDQGRQIFMDVGCAQCHVPDLIVERDRRAADVETIYDPQNGSFNELFATATPLLNAVNDNSGFPDLKLPQRGSFVVRNIFADFRRHDLGPNFWERNFDGTLQKEFMTEPLWGVGTTAPYGHDGRSINLDTVIRRHGGAALTARNTYTQLTRANQRRLRAFLDTLVIFGPPDTASNLDPANPMAADYPQRGHGSIDLSPLFNNPADKE